MAQSEILEPLAVWRRVPLPPILLLQVDPELQEGRLVGPEAAASNVLAGGEEKERPVLHPLRLLSRYLPRQPFPNLFPGQRTSDEPGHSRIAPEREGQREVLR